MNYNGSSLVLLNVLELSEDIIITGRSSLLATTRALQQRLFDVGDVGAGLPPFMSRELHRQAHWAYFWLRIDYDDSQPTIAAGFYCLVCRFNPDALIADGVTLGTEEERLLWGGFWCFFVVLIIVFYFIYLFRNINCVFSFNLQRQRQP
jgi:hypothetical protein